MVVKSLQHAHTADTRRTLVDAARRLFARGGYAGTSLDQVCKQAGVTKGALYHHFRNKEDLFAAVLAVVEEDFVAAGAAAVAPGADIWEALRAAARGFLEVCAGRDTSRIVTEAPAVLGWARCRELEHAHAMGLLRSGLDRAVTDGELTSGSPELLAQLLAAVFNEAGMIVATSSEPDIVRYRAVEELDRLIIGLQSQRGLT
jgi:AcrR family transcriptional regulator